MTKEKRIEYTVEQKLEFYEQKLTIALAAGGAGKNVFEKIYYAELAKDITIRLKQLLDDKR